MMNPLWMMMEAMTRPMNPYGGNGLVHPVYVTPTMMHKLERSVPEWKDPSEDNARAGNMDCGEGLTVECDGQSVEKILCFGGCADRNPCDTNLYSSFMAGDAACDGDSWWYYTCESFEEMQIFGGRCAKHSEEGAKIDVAKGADPEYAQWAAKVRANRRSGKGRDIIYDDGQTADGPGAFSLGAGEYGNVPWTDHDLGNVGDRRYHYDTAQGQWEALRAPRNVMHREDDDGNDRGGNDNDIVRGDTAPLNAVRFSGDLLPLEWPDAAAPSGYAEQEVMEWMVVGVWSLCFMTLSCCLCCIAMALCARCRYRNELKTGNERNGGEMVEDPV